MVGEPYKRVLLKEAVKAQFTAAIAAEAAAQVKDDMTDEEKKRLNK